MTKASPQEKQRGGMAIMPSPSHLFLSTLFILLPILANADHAEVDDRLLPYINKADPSHDPRKHVYSNEIDKCWRKDPNWAKKRATLAMCSVGFCGKMKKNRGQNITWYVVTDPGDDGSTPTKGMLRYGANLPGKVWITFQHNMFIRLEKPLLVSNYTTIDGRGVKVHIAFGSGFFLFNAAYVIIHGLHFHNINGAPGSRVAIRGGHVIPIALDEGDAIRVVGGYRIWIDHNTFWKANDGLIDVTLGSTKVTISNNWFKDHDKVMLLGHEDHYVADKKMKVTLVYNRFGPNCVQRMPRIRHGYVHVANNMYLGWESYAIGGGMDPTVLSQGNKYITRPDAKERKVIILRESGDAWHVRSEGDIFVNGAFFSNQSDTVISPKIVNYNNRKERTNPRYCLACRFPVKSADLADLLTEDAGALECKEGELC